MQISIDEKIEHLLRLTDFNMWRNEDAETNAEQMHRLKKHLKQAILEELTPTQREFLIAHYFENKRVTDIALQCGVSKSSVSRTLGRAEARIKRVLKYSM